MKQQDFGNSPKTIKRGYNKNKRNDSEVYVPPTDESKLILQEIFEKYIKGENKNVLKEELPNLIHDFEHAVSQSLVGPAEKLIKKLSNPHIKITFRF